MQEKALEEIGNAPTLEALQEVRVKYLGKKGEVTGRLKSLGSLSLEERKEAGREINVLKKTLEEAVEARKEALEREALNRKLESESLDVTLPGTQRGAGGLHLLTRVTNRLTDVFRGMGYDVVVGPELEDEFHNFDALNTPRLAPRARPARHLLDDRRPPLTHPHLAHAGALHGNAQTALQGGGAR